MIDIIAPIVLWLSPENIIMIENIIKKWRYYL